ncbi:uncharacterized protein LOC107046303 [Diachasma alloeum]|uniref:uncharacterized protein LOC107046303 n=1 Tax=Diachasma alloeum TaxID=454923 RepID=UPI000738167C|nr:uncharacterized protein LOC107046303 [Diachasma alloeum]
MLTCGNKQRSIPSWCPDLQSTKHWGYSHLQRTLAYYPKLWNVQCSCGASKQEENISNAHVYLELDVRQSAKESAATCDLYDVPQALTFNREYRLAGIIHYSAKEDHFIAYCRRQSGSWEIHNGLHSKVEPVRGNPRIQPNCAIYIMNQQETGIQSSKAAVLDLKGIMDKEKNCFNCGDSSVEKEKSK